MTEFLSYAAASLAWVTAVCVLWHRDTVKAIAEERKAKEDGRLR